MKMKNYAGVYEDYYVTRALTVVDHLSIIPSFFCDFDGESLSRKCDIITLLYRIFHFLGLINIISLLNRN